MGLVDCLKELGSRRIPLGPLKVHTQNIFRRLVFSCLLVTSVSSCSGSDAGTSLSNSEISNCQDFLLGVDILAELSSSLGLGSEITLLEKLRFAGTSTSERLDAWDTILQKQFLNLENFGVSDNKELSGLVFDVKRKYVAARTRFSAAKTYDEATELFGAYTTSSNRLEAYCENNA
jgi:hypothetical protein